MIEFDSGRHLAMIKLSLMGVSVNMNLDLRKAREEPLLVKAGLAGLPEGRLKALLEYTDHRFKVDPRSPLPWKEQFFLALGRDAEVLRKAVLKLTPAELKELRRVIKDTHGTLEKAIGAVAGSGVMDLALKYQYHDGFHHLTRDDDFFAVRCGNRIVGIIPLKGNDRNELLKFLKAGADAVLDPTNVESFRKCVRHAKKLDAAQLVREVTVKTVTTVTNLALK